MEIAAPSELYTLLGRRAVGSAYLGAGESFLTLDGRIGSDRFHCGTPSTSKSVTAMGTLGFPVNVFVIFCPA